MKPYVGGGGGDNISVCDIGGLYCGPAREFIDRNPGCTVCAVDFKGLVHLGAFVPEGGTTVCAVDFKGLVHLNADLLGNGLEAKEGYPLEVIEKFAEEGKVFDFVTFTRTATLINIEQLKEYMKILSKIARNVIFLEVCNLQSTPLISLDLRTINPEKSLKLYNGMYVHNYMALLQDNHMKVTELYHLNNKAFDQIFSPDHYFVYAHGINTQEI